MRKHFVALREILLRLTPPHHRKIIQTETFEAAYGGAEANVAVSLSRFGHRVSFVTRLPTNALGEAAIGFLNRYGVRTDRVVRGGERLGLYFLDAGVSLRPSEVIYDRKDSAMATACPGEFDWDRLLAGADWLHTSGITLAISPNARRIVTDAVQSAKRHGVTVSFDFNYRSKLWSREEAREAIVSVLPYVDICFAGRRDVEEILGYPTAAKSPEAVYRELLGRLIRTYDIRCAAATLRTVHSASKNSLAGVAVTRDGEVTITDPYHFEIADRIGGGDAFAAGFIHGFVSREKVSHALEFALAASVLKHTLVGDANVASVQEVEFLMQAREGGEVDR